MEVNSDMVSTKPLLHSSESARNRDSCSYRCLIMISRIAADCLAVVPFFVIGVGALYLENLYSINSASITLITSIGTVALMICSGTIVHLSCNKFWKVEDEDVKDPFFIPYIPH